MGKAFGIRAVHVIGEEDEAKCLTSLSRRGDARNLAKRKPRYTS